MNIIERKNSTFTHPTCYQKLSIFRYSPHEIKVICQTIYNDGISYSELVKLEEYERRNRK